MCTVHMQGVLLSLKMVCDKMAKVAWYKFVLDQSGKLKSHSLL